MDLPSTLDAIQIAIECLGPEWYARRVKAEKRRNEEIYRRAERSGRKFEMLKERELHPLVDCGLSLDSWREGCESAGRVILRPEIDRIVQLGIHLDRARFCAGYQDSIPNRLRNTREFPSAAFEVETAATNLAMGYSVRFVPQKPGMQTPDLIITRKDGVEVSAECKRLSTLHEEEIVTFWNELSRQILERCESLSVNRGVSVTSKQDPVWADLNALFDFIQSRLSLLDTQDLSDPTGKYSVQISRLKGFVPAELLRPQPNHEVYLSAGSGVRQEDGRLPEWIARPKFVGCLNKVKRDLQSTAKSAFKAAVDQIPPSGPGTIWLRLPHSIQDPTYHAIARTMQRELSGPHNRRVNSVFLVTTEWSSPTPTRVVNRRVHIDELRHQSPKVSIRQPWHPTQHVEA
jgi:hypothetical protein